MVVKKVNNATQPIKPNISSAKRIVPRIILIYIIFSAIFLFVFCVCVCAPIQVYPICTYTTNYICHMAVLY